jgi:Domain of unknown function (DUF4157)
MMTVLDLKKTSSQPVSTSRSQAGQKPNAVSMVRPQRPSNIPVNANERLGDASFALPLQRKLAVGSGRDPHELEADAMAARVSVGGMGGRVRASRPADGIGQTEAPPIVHKVLRGEGQPLDGGTRALMEPRFGRDLSGVRVHTGAQADESARAVGARAYAVGHDTVFAAGQYNPGSREGLRLLAHEVSHTVQQTGGGGAGGGLSSAAPAVAREPTPQDAPKKDDANKKPDPVTVTAPAEELLNPSGPIAPVKGSGQASGGGTGQTPGATPAVPAPQQYTPSQPPLTPGYTPLPPLPSQAGGSAAGAGSAAPSRLSLHDFGRLSLGLRLGFPELERNPDAPPSALQESIRKGEILNFQLTGQLPSEYKLDPGKLVGAAWGIFSQRIAPDIAAKIAAGMSSKPQGGGVSLQLDTVLIIDSSATKKGGGGGVSLTLTF